MSQSVNLYDKVIVLSLFPFREKTVKKFRFWNSSAVKYSVKKDTIFNIIIAFEYL